MTYLGFLRQLAATTQGELRQLSGQLSRGEVRAPSRDERFFGRVRSAYFEISASVEALEDAPIYLRRFPFRGTRITRPRYLAFHIEAYLHESYILRERVHALSKLLARSYRFTHYDLKNLSSADGEFEARLRPLMSLRGKHVHEQRFVDEDIEMLSRIQFLVEQGLRPTELEMRFFDYESKRLGRRLAHRLLQINEQVVQPALDVYFAAVSELVYRPDGQMNYPSPAEGAR